MSNINLKDGITEVLVEYANVVKELFEPAGPISRGDPNTSQNVFRKLLDTDLKLHQYVKQLEDHQAFQEKLRQLDKEMAALDHQIYEVAMNLKTVEHPLMNSVENEKNHIQTIKKSVSVLAPEIVSYGHKISYTTSAPSGWIPSQVAVFKPPAPQEEQVRSGLLYTKIPDDILNFYNLEDPTRTQATTKLEDATDSHSTTFSELEKIASSDLSKLNIPPPPQGWKAGMPINIPPPPKGWKPGDPLFPRSAETNLADFAGAGVPNGNSSDVDMNADLAAQAKNDLSDSSSSDEDSAGPGDGVVWE